MENSKKQNTASNKAVSTSKASNLANDIAKGQVGEKPAKKQVAIKKATKKAVLEFLPKQNKIVFAKGWQSGVLKGIEGHKNNQNCELYFLNRELTRLHISLYDPNGQKVNLKSAVDYTQSKFDDKVKFWLKWEGIHSQAFKAVFERLEGRDYPLSVIGLLNSKGYTFK